jgi:hypothetical protein
VTEMADLQTIAWSVVGAGGGGAIIAVGTFKALGTKWLDSHFAERLQALKHAHEQEMAHLKVRVDGQLDRAVKLNQREFEVVPAIWKSVTEAHYDLIDLIAVMRSERDLSQMSEPEFEAFIADSRLQEWQKVEMRELNGYARTSYWSEKNRWFRLSDTNRAIIEFNHTLLTNSIFLHPDTFAKFDAFSAPMRKAYHRWQLGMQHGREFHIPPEGKDDPIEAYREQGAGLYQELATYLREHFYGVAGG